MNVRTQPKDIFYEAVVNDSRRGILKATLAMRNKVLNILLTFDILLLILVLFTDTSKDYQLFAIINLVFVAVMRFKTGLDLRLLNVVDGLIERQKGVTH